VLSSFGLGWKRGVRAIHHAVFHESREGRAAEIAAWSNGAAAVVCAGGMTFVGWHRLPFHAAWLGLLVGAVMFAALRFTLTHRFTVWIAASFGTLTVAAIGGVLAWLFAHLLELSAAPPIAAIAGALLAALAPAWSYAHLARRRAQNVRDSLVDPVSAPHSR
jgi:hypothetical protein